MSARVGSRERETETGPLVRCLRCEATNSGHRTRCGRCGADLETGSRERGRSAPVPAPTSEEQPAYRRRRVAAVIIVAAVIGVIAGVVAWHGAGDAPPERPAFDPGVYPEDPAPLVVTNVTASTTDGPAEGDRPDAGLLADDDPRTAWVAATDGVDEALTFRLAGPAWIGRVAFWNGDQSEVARFDRHGRAHHVRLRVGDDVVYEVVLEEVVGEQVVELPDPVLARAVTVEIVATYPADEPLALSGVRFDGWEARGADRDRGD